ncbi:MAG TPA: hypothetical protein VHG09_13545, partial [Longimicrobiales bacterium]|nr:hypothetical protein [Longimicrobiales bacterium]
ASDPSGPGPYRQLGVLMISGWSGTRPVDLDNGDGLEWNRTRSSADYTAPDVLVAPDTVGAGQAFEIRTNTVGWNGCWRSDGQTVATVGRVVVIRPYDSHSGSEVCTDVLLLLAHSSTLVLDEPGEWTLRVDGRQLRMGDDVSEQPISAERTIVVR